MWRCPSAYGACLKSSSAWRLRPLVQEMVGWREGQRPLVHRVWFFEGGGATDGLANHLFEGGFCGWDGVHFASVYRTWRRWWPTLFWCCPFAVRTRGYHGRCLAMKARWASPVLMSVTWSWAKMAGHYMVDWLPSQTEPAEWYIIDWRRWRWGPGRLQMVLFLCLPKSALQSAWSEKTALLCETIN